QEPVCGGRELSSASGFAGIYPAAEFSQRNRGRHSKCPPLLQRRRARPEHEDSILPDQHSGRDVRLPTKTVLRSRGRRSRARGREILGMRPQRFRLGKGSASGFTPWPSVSSMIKALLFVLLSTLLTAASAAQSHSWRVADFQDTISIATDGTALVSRFLLNTPDRREPTTHSSSMSSASPTKVGTS